ncbi:NAD synthetase [Mesobacillus boroniphilus JCM 21738]|uniref:NAD synthetase n=1 Tax=Mesobacillus boroniphilus JCM 21738 TaxID=1294265 RepID=W4RSX5_9BACI|nr:NAD synthetase [Mesobacillus boroniphilus JCM 21738]
MSLQKEIIEALNVRPEIDPQEEIRKRIDFLKEYLLTSKAKGFVLGISGGRIPPLPEDWHSSRSRNCARRVLKPNSWL